MKADFKEEKEGKQEEPPRRSRRKHDWVSGCKSLTHRGGKASGRSGIGEDERQPVMT